MDYICFLTSAAMVAVTIEHLHWFHKLSEIHLQKQKAKKGESHEGRKKERNEGLNLKNKQ